MNLSGIKRLKNFEKGTGPREFGIKQRPSHHTHIQIVYERVAERKRLLASMKFFRDLKAELIEKIRYI